MPVVQAHGNTPEESIGFLDDGVAINSPLINGLATFDAKKKIIAWLEEKGAGRADVRCKLRDWLFSRQRYWGEPFPIVWENGQHRSLGDDELPLVPPELEDYKPTGTGEPPLAKAKDWIRYSEKATRETNTMPQWAGSCWYYLRFCDPKNDGRVSSAKKPEALLDGRGAMTKRRTNRSELRKSAGDAIRSTLRHCFVIRHSSFVFSGVAGCAWISTMAGRSMLFCISFTRAFGTRFCMISGTSPSRSRFSDSLTRE